MKQRYLLLITLSLCNLSLLGAQCELTYEQGYLKGHDLGVSENYEHEHTEALKALIKKHDHCPEYVRGLKEAYEVYRYSGISTCAEFLNQPVRGKWNIDLDHSTTTPSRTNTLEQLCSMPEGITT